MKNRPAIKQIVFELLNPKTISGKNQLDKYFDEMIKNNQLKNKNMKKSQLPSQFQINDEVFFNASESAKIKAKVAGVSFTESTVFYDLVVEHSKGVHYYINGANSAFISSLKND